jgi:hypothetical protein
MKRPRDDGPTRQHNETGRVFPDWEIGRPVFGSLRRKSRKHDAASEEIFNPPGDAQAIFDLRKVALRIEAQCRRMRHPHHAVRRAKSGQTV